MILDENIRKLALEFIVFLSLLLRLELENHGKKVRMIVVKIPLFTSDLDQVLKLLHLKCLKVLKVLHLALFFFLESLLTTSFIDQVPYFLKFKGNDWTVKDVRMRTLRSRDYADGVNVSLFFS